MSHSSPVEGFGIAVLAALHFVWAGICTASLEAQAPALPDSTVVVPGPHYEAGGLYRAFMGGGVP